MKKVILVSVVCLTGFICTVVFGNNLENFLDSKEETNLGNGKLERILTHKELRVVVDFNTINYFIYKGEPQGFQYEILKEFCADNGLDLTIDATNNLPSAIVGLIHDEYDLVAKNVFSGYVDNKLVEFTQPLLKTKILLVQRKNGKASNDGNVPYCVKNRGELAHRTVHVSGNTSYGFHMQKLSSDLERPISVVTDTSATTEQLLEKVSEGEIDYTICSEKTANFVGSHFNTLDFSTPIAFDQEFSWLVANKSTKWKEYLDTWIVAFKQSDRYQEICEKYYSESANGIFSQKKFNSILGGKLSDYDDVVKSVASVYDFDWRLISSIIYRESRFDSQAKSTVGASGLMQLMPITAKLFNVFDTSVPSENIRGGVAYLSWLDETFAPVIPDEKERLKFVLASYNVGIGHVMDARRLAMKYNRNPSVWDDNVEYFLMKKSEAAFYNDPVVEHGYCRSAEPLAFVEKVLDRYTHYVNIIPGEEKKSLAAL